MSEAEARRRETIDEALDAALAHVRGRRLAEAREQLLAVAARFELEGIGPGDPRRGRAGAMLGHVLRLMGDRDEAHTLLLRVVAECRAQRWAGPGAHAAVGRLAGPLHRRHRRGRALDARGHPLRRRR
ncbi:MAG: hypothetical protein R3F59_23485 [Myxococcota bacterium]